MVVVRAGRSVGLVEAWDIGHGLLLAGVSMPAWLDRFEWLTGLTGRTEFRWLVLLLAVLLVSRWISRRVRAPRRKRGEVSPLDVDLQSLLVAAPDDAACRLRVYHLPVRVGLVVLAPLGREAATPHAASIPELLDAAVPGLGDVVQADAPAVRIWPVQLSADGFRHAFRRHVKTPDADLRRSRWCLVAGRITVDDNRYMLGLALCAAEPNQLELIGVESEQHWLDVLRLGMPA